MIDHKRKFIFLHVPKTAGNSIIKNIGLEKFPPCHLPLSKYNKLHTDNYFKFAFIRNPWDRFVSAYWYLKDGGDGTSPQDLRAQESISKYDTFSDFVKHDNFFQICHFKPLLFFIDRAIDFIGRVETIQQDFNTICDKIGITRQQLPHKNKSNHKHYTEYYNEQTKQIVAKKYAKDIAYFEYEFGKG